MSHKINISDPLYKNWLLAGLGLKYVKDGIQELIVSEVELCHKTMLNDIETTFSLTRPIDCFLQTIVSYPIKKPPNYGVFQCDLDSSSDPSMCAKDCPNAVCYLIMKDIIQTHRWKRPIWCNTNPHQWASHPWEVAKCFLSSSGYEHVTSTKDTDCSGLLSIIINMKCIGDKLNLCDKDVKSGQDIFSKVCSIYLQLNLKFHI